MCVFVCHRKLRDALVFRVLLFAFLSLSVQSFKIVYKDSAHWEYTVQNGVGLYFLGEVLPKKKDSLLFTHGNTWD